ncbi:hypothetical protein HanRHA438_Chr17g0819471 [Helianthus annuus]|nr:hypothetical protein HanRHA438_Chr17g0819471 [Helianthus annuus]
MTLRFTPHLTLSPLFRFSITETTTITFHYLHFLLQKLSFKFEDLTIEVQD